MTRRKETRAEKAQRMAALIQEAETSGYSLAEFARQHGIAEQTLYWWRKRLGREAIADEAPALVPVEVRDPVRMDVAQLEISVADDLELRLPINTPPAKVAELVTALRRC